MVIARNSNLLGKITILIMVNLCINTALALDGSGTEEDPWRIKSLADFDEFAAYANYWDDYTRLETDVNLAGITYSTAVIAPDMGNAFTGVFDGNDHKVLNLTINDGGAGNKYVGLFGCIGLWKNGGEVRNLGIEGCYVSGDDYVGGLAGYNYYSTISNCYATGAVAGSAQVGGLVGKNGWDCTVSNCYATGNVSGDWLVGGLVGTNYGYDTMVLNCYATGTVSGSGRMGGLVGRNEGAVADCYATGNVSGNSYDVGGLVGENQEYGTVSNCYATGIVSGGGTIGGLVGWNWSGMILNCYATGTVTGDYEVGGLVGYNHAKVSNCNAKGNVNGNNRVGGLVGEVSAGIIEHCFAIGNVNGTGDRVGGLVGENSSYLKFYKSCFWNIDINPDLNGIGNKTDPNVVGLPTTEMQTRNTFTEVGWDFINAWNIGENQTYPYLRVYLPSDMNKDGIVNFLDVAITANQWMEGDITDE